MLRPRSILACALVWFLSDRLMAGDPAPTQTVSSDGLVYHSPIPVNSPFPDADYGAGHRGSTLSLSYPFLSPFGNTDHSRGQFTYSCAAFVPRRSEGIFGMDLWLERQNPDGSWSPVDQNGGLPDNFGQAYQPINTPNPGPSPSYAFHWTFDPNRLSSGNYRVFVYVYIYNQGGGSQGDFAIYSATTVVSAGSANDAPRISWSPTGGAINATTVTVGQSYVVSADAQDDNGDLIAVSIDKNGVPFGYANGGNGFSGNSHNTTSDPEGTVTYTAWAEDYYGGRSPTITWTVQVLGKAAQAPVASSDATIPFPQAFTPTYTGGSGSGAWQFAIAGYTNWTAGADPNGGTQIYPGNAWSPSWTAPAPGTYAFYVAKDGDASYTPSAIAGPYTLTMTPAAPLGAFDTVAPGSVTQGQSLFGNGWAVDPQMGAPVTAVQLLVDAGRGGSFQAILGGSRPDVQVANASFAHWSPKDVTAAGWSFVYDTSGLAIGSHSLTAVAANAYGLSTTLGTKTFSVTALLAQSVTIFPASVSINVGDSVTFTAAGGVNGYVWGGSASGSGPTQTATFPSPGNYVVTVYSPAGNGSATSNIATANIAVGVLAHTVSIAPQTATIIAGDSVTFTASGGQNGYIWGGSASGAGTTQTVTFPNPGNYVVTVSSPGGNGYPPSNTATANIAVGVPAHTVAIAPPAAIVTAGGSVTFAASGGQNGYVWGGAAGGSGTSQFVSFPNVGSYSVTVYSPAGGAYPQSNVASAIITVTPAAQSVTIVPVLAQVGIGQSVTFTASGGMNGYQWGGAASGSGPTQTVTFPSPGTFSVTVFSPAGGNFAASNAATATVTVQSSGQTVALAPPTASVIVGGSVSFTATGGLNDYVWGGAASGGGASQLVYFPNVGSYTVTVYSPPGGGYAQSNTASADVTVTTAGQIVSLMPLSPQATVDDPITFTASGGMNGYAWGGAAAGSGPTQTLSWQNPGTYTVTVYSPAGGNFAASNLASTDVTVSGGAQTVAIVPPSAAVVVGGSLSFNASGGHNGYVWGGAASGSGGTQLVVFPNVGSYVVTVYSPAVGTYAQSNTASANVTVTAAIQTVTLTPTSPQVVAGESVAFTANGGMNGYQWGGAASGGGVNQTVTFADPGTFTVTVFSPAGGNFAASNTAVATVTVLPSPGSAEVIVKPQGGEVKVENSKNKHNSQVIVPGS